MSDPFEHAKPTEKTRQSKPGKPRGAPPAGRRQTKPSEKPWLDLRESLRESAATRVGDVDTRREAIGAGAEELFDERELEWGKEYEGFGDTGCYSLPFIAAAKGGLMSMAQARRLSTTNRGGANGDTLAILDVLNFVPWSKAPASRRWGNPEAKAKKGDVAVFASRVDENYVEHVALFANASGDIWSLEPSAEPGSSQPLRKSHVNAYIDETTNRMLADPDSGFTEEHVEKHAFGCVICQFPF